MGGRSTGGARNSVGSLSKAEVLKIADNYLTYNVQTGTQSTKATAAEIVSDIDENGMANVKIEYETRNKVMVGYDVETQREEYDWETSYHTDTFRIKVRK